MLSVPPYTVLSFTFEGTTDWRGSPGTIQLLLLRGTAAPAALQRAATQMLPMELLDLESSRKGLSISRRDLFIYISF